MNWLLSIGWNINKKMEFMNRIAIINDSYDSQLRCDTYSSSLSICQINYHCNSYRKNFIRLFSLALSLCFSLSFRCNFLQHFRNDSFNTFVCVWTSDLQCSVTRLRTCSESDPFRGYISSSDSEYVWCNTICFKLFYFSLIFGSAPVGRNEPISAHFRPIRVGLKKSVPCRPLVYTLEYALVKWRSKSVAYTIFTNCSINNLKLKIIIICYRVHTIAYNGIIRRLPWKLHKYKIHGQW